MADKEPGYVYILTNPSFREDWVKIGKSSRPVDVRSKELDNTAVPLPFEIFATMKTTKYNEVEKLVHKTKHSPFVGTFMPEEHRNTSGAYQGAKYFSYNGIIPEKRTTSPDFRCSSYTSYDTLHS